MERVRKVLMKTDDHQDAAERLISRLSLVPHPEGGHYREFYRSPLPVPYPGMGVRPGATIIYYLLKKGERSAWHRIRSEEVWQFVTGDPLELHTVSSDFRTFRTNILALEDGADPACTVPPGIWQAARSLGSFSLVICTVSPGFDFKDLEFLDPAHPAIFSLPDEEKRLVFPFLRK